jgi:hypothetical protein
MKKLKPIIKLNNGNGAILCNKCHTIIKSNLSKEEFKGKTDIIWCDKCAPIELEKYLKNTYEKTS